MTFRGKVVAARGPRKWVPYACHDPQVDAAVLASVLCRPSDAEPEVMRRAVENLHAGRDIDYLDRLEDEADQNELEVRDYQDLRGAAADAQAAEGETEA